MTQRSLKGEGRRGTLKVVLGCLCSMLLLCSCYGFIYCSIAMFTHRRMSRASGWSTLRGVSCPTTAQSSRCSTTILLKAEQLPGKRSRPLRSISPYHAAHWEFWLKQYAFHHLWTLSSSSGGFEGNTSGTNSVSRAAAAQHRGSGGWGNASALTFPQ